MFDENRINALLRGEKFKGKEPSNPKARTLQKPKTKTKPDKPRNAKIGTDIQLAEWSAREALQEKERAQLQSQLQELRERLQSSERDWKKRESDLQAKVDSYRIKWQSVGESFVALQKEVAGLQENNKCLQQQLSVIPPSVPRDSIKDILHERGLYRNSEQRMALKALAEREDFQLDDLSTSSGEALRQILRGKFILLSESAPREASFDRSVVLVESERCEITGGTDFERSLRLFKDAMLMNGLTKAVFFGIDVAHQEILRPSFSHHALQITLLSDSQELTKEEKMAMYEKNQLVLIWGKEAGLPHPHLFASQAKTLGQFLHRAAEHFLEAL